MPLAKVISHSPETEMGVLELLDSTQIPFWFKGSLDEGSYVLCSIVKETAIINAVNIRYTKEN